MDKMGAPRAAVKCGPAPSNMSDNPRPYRTFFAGGRRGFGLRDLAAGGPPRRRQQTGRTLPERLVTWTLG